MAANHRTIADIRSRTARSYWGAKLWEGVYRQDQRWIPRGAWAAYREASLRGVKVHEALGELDGKPVTVGPVAIATWCSPDLNVAGSVAIDDMELSWRRSAVSFLWRQSRRHCAALAWGTFHTSDPFRDEMPDDVVDEIIDADLEWDRRANDEAVRRAWFDSTPLVRKLRDSIIEERERRITRPVLLGGQPEVPASTLIAP